MKYSDAQLVPISGGVHVIIYNMPVIRAVPIVGNGKHTSWRCACGRELRNDTLLLRHVRSFHYAQAYQLQGFVAAPVAPIRFIPARECRARIPWRVHAPEYD